MSEHKILPFYMSYPLPASFGENNDMVKDLEYLQEMYPSEAKLLQQEIAKTLALYEYKGSMLYDQYPDRFMLYKLGKDICEKIKVTHKDDPEDSQIKKLLMWEGIDEMVLIILFFEILKRRHKNNLGYFRF